MEKTELRERMRKVANTLCATKMRIDQVEATNRLRACASELLSMLEELDKDTEEGGEEDERNPE